MSSPILRKSRYIPPFCQLQPLDTCRTYGVMLACCMETRIQTAGEVPDSSQEQKILMLLLSSWPSWTPAPVLSHISLQYSRAIHGLRRKGWQIANRVEYRDGVKHG